jgi:hypothetical protein
VSRTRAAQVGVVGWLVLLLSAPERSPRAMAVWGLVCAAVVAVVVVGARSLSLLLKRAVDR